MRLKRKNVPPFQFQFSEKLLYTSFCEIRSGTNPMALNPKRFKRKTKDPITVTLMTSHPLKVLNRIQRESECSLFYKKKAPKIIVNDKVLAEVERLGQSRMQRVLVAAASYISGFGSWDFRRVEQLEPSSLK